MELQRPCYRCGLAERRTLEDICDSCKLDRRKIEYDRNNPTG